MSRGKAIVPHSSGLDNVTLELPPYAARYLKKLCARERGILANLANTGTYSVAIDAAIDALTQIEDALALL